MGSGPAERVLLLGAVLAITTVCSAQHLNSVEKNGVFFSGLPRPDSELNAITEKDTTRNTPSRAGLPNKKLGGTNRQLTGTTPFDFRFNSAKPDNRFTLLRTTPRPDIAGTLQTTRAAFFTTEKRATSRATTARPTLAPTTTRIPTQAAVRTPSRPVFSGGTNLTPPKTTVTTTANSRATNGPTATQGTLSFSFRRASLTTGGNQSPPEILTASAPSIEDISTPGEATQGTPRQPVVSTGRTPPARPTTFQSRAPPVGSQRPPAPPRATATPTARSTTVTTRNTQGERTTRISTESAPALGLSFTRIASTNQGSREPQRITTERRFATRPSSTPGSITQRTQKLPTTRATLPPTIKSITIPRTETQGTQRLSTTRATLPPTIKSITIPRTETQGTQRLPTTRATLPPTVRSITIPRTETQGTQQTPLRFAFCDKVLCSRSCRQKFGAKLNSSDCLNNACKCEVDEGCKPDVCLARCRESSTNLRSAVCEDGTCKCLSRERCTSSRCIDQCRRTHAGKEVLSASCQGETCQCAIKRPCNIEDCTKNCQKAQGNRLFSAECSDQDICRCLHT
uniref:Putative mucin-5ac n=1 Tax=Ixodes ricinus TaxID=34613 RepID=A0A6B0VFP6_IXORI